MSYTDIIKKNPNSAFLLLGSRRGGKTSWLKSILIDKATNIDNWADEIYVYTIQINKQVYLDAGIPEENIKFELTPDDIEEIIEIQTELKEDDNCEMLNIIIILDDCLGSKRNKYKLESIVENLFSLGRHLLISTYILVQDYRYVSFLFVNADFLVLFPKSIRKSSHKELMIKEILSNYTDNDKLLHDLLYNCKAHEFVMIHLTSLEDDFEKLCWKSKAPKKLIDYKFKKKKQKKPTFTEDVKSEVNLFTEFLKNQE